MKAIIRVGEAPGKTPEERLRQYERRFEAGERGAMMDALGECARSGLPMPRWLADEWLKIYGEILTGRKIDLNAALGFNVTDPRVRYRTHVIATRAAEVGNEILRGRKAGRAIDDGLKEEVADRLGLTLRQVRECWAACTYELEAFGLKIDDFSTDQVDVFSDLIRPAPKRN